MNIKEIVNSIKEFLMEDEKEFDPSFSWKEFVDNQELGDCQSIVAMITQKFNCKKCFGEIEIDEPYIDEDGEEQKFMTHHWIQIGNQYYDFSKGTLKNYIDFDSTELYDPDIYDNWRYNLIDVY